MNLCQHLSNQFIFDGIANTKYSIAENYQNLVLIGENYKTVGDLISGIIENLLEKLIFLLKPFHSLRTTLCRDSFPTFHLVFPTKQKLQSMDTENLLIFKYR